MAKAFGRFPNDEAPMKVTPLLVEFVHCLLLEVQ
jgi:hypothetical protein